MVNYIRVVLRAVSPIKIALYIATFILSVPILGILYWTFDTTYLAAFGVGPEFYSRPIFSSSLINIWLFASSVKPGIWAWMGLSSLIFFLYFIKHYNAPDAKGSSESQKKLDADRGSFLHKVESFLNVVFKAGPPALVFFFFGLAMIVSALHTMTFFSNDSSILAKKQIAAYIDNKTCMDAFNDSHLGCYSIPGEAGDNHLLILNSKDVIIYMSRLMQDGATEEVFTVTVKSKVSQEKITRRYHYVEETKESEE